MITPFNNDNLIIRQKGMNSKRKDLRYKSMDKE